MLVLEKGEVFHHFCGLRGGYMYVSHEQRQVLELPLVREARMLVVRHLRPDVDELLFADRIRVVANSLLRDEAQAENALLRRPARVPLELLGELERLSVQLDVFPTRRAMVYPQPNQDYRNALLERFAEVETVHAVGLGLIEHQFFAAHLHEGASRKQAAAHVAAQHAQHNVAPALESDRVVAQDERIELTRALDERVREHHARLFANVVTREVDSLERTVFREARSDVARALAERRMRKAERDEAGIGAQPNRELLHSARTHVIPAQVERCERKVFGENVPDCSRPGFRDAAVVQIQLGQVPAGNWPQAFGNQDGSAISEFVSREDEVLHRSAALEH
mmetsp:Transcript_18758/g.61255  ORF Transcript_18758/g.61255 Transcript_18758/m.61255 type:complete len:338 (-) Transcript_18758:447-1460(-)